MSDAVPSKFTVPFSEYTRLAMERDALDKRLAEAERLLQEAQDRDLEDGSEWRERLDAFLASLEDKP